jgi:hypothetical protein
MKRLLIVMGCLLLIAAPPVGATTWDVAADFPGTGNPNGVWSYGWELPLGSALNWFTHLGNNGWQGSPYWNELGNSDAPPIVWKNIGANNYGVKTGEVSLHPGDDLSGTVTGKYTVVRWTSPVAGTVNISGYFGQGDINAMDYFIYQDGTEIRKSINDSNDYDFSFNRAVSPGTTIDFIVGNHYAYGNTPLHATITANSVVPIPGVVWLLGSGLAGLAGWRRFRKG